MTDGTLVTETFTGDLPEQKAPSGSWVSRPVAEDISEAMERAPMGAVYEIAYAALARRLKRVLDPTSPAGHLLTHSLVNSAVNFRAINPGFIASAVRHPATPPDSGAGAGAYHSKVWGQSPDQRLPTTDPLPVDQVPYAVGQDPNPAQNRGLLIAKLFYDLQHHLPCVLFNVVSKTYVPVGVGGSSVTRRYRDGGLNITELSYKVMLTVEATVVTEDDESTSALQAITEAAFGTLRDQIDNGATIGGRSWQLLLPVRLSPSNINEVDAPWSQGDDKGSKLYTASVSLDDMMFECFSYVAKPVTGQFTDNLEAAGAGLPASIQLPNDPDPTGPMQLRLGMPQRLVVTGSTVMCDLAVSQTKRVVDLRRPYDGRGVYEVIPRRTGEATIYLYDTGSTVPAMTSTPSAGRVGLPLVERKVVVSAV